MMYATVHAESVTFSTATLSTQNRRQRHAESVISEPMNYAELVTGGLYIRAESVTDTNRTVRKNPLRAFHRHCGKD